MQEDSSRDEYSVESPEWHKAVLRDREEALKAGKDTLSDWEKTKERIRKNVRG
ncbi:MAG TPA: addiction module protein [Phycisphaerae bacterium]|nr:addiction module protein [Phycisphaerae bacterium]HQL74326.1 addiction module protein [Phycisphaerae bacterium]